MVSGQPPRRGRSSRDGEPPPGATEEGNAASGSPTEASGSAHVLGDVASRRLAKAAAAAGAAAAESIDPAGAVHARFAVSRAESVPVTAAESVAAESAAAQTAVAIDAPTTAAGSAAPKPRKNTRKAAAAALAPDGPLAAAAASPAAPTAAVSAAPKPRKTSRKALGPAAHTGSEFAAAATLSVAASSDDGRPLRGSCSRLST